MKLKNILLTSLFVSGLATAAHAQTANEAFIFSQENNGGTARLKALGNAKTALGGDIGSITGNPAGLGFFAQSDISITAGYNNAANRGSYFGSETSRNKGRFGIDHAGAVFHFPKNAGFSGWQNFNVGLSYENTNLLNNNVRYEGTNPDNTIVSAYSDDVAFFNDQSFANDLSGLKLVERFSDATKGYFPITGEVAAIVRGRLSPSAETTTTSFISEVISVSPLFATKTQSSFRNSAGPKTAARYLRTIPTRRSSSRGTPTTGISTRITNYLTTTISCWRAQA
jgi:hypothetical protein